MQKQSLEQGCSFAAESGGCDCAIMTDVWWYREGHPPKETNGIGNSLGGERPVSHIECDCYRMTVML